MANGAWILSRGQQDAVAKPSSVLCKLARWAVARELIARKRFRVLLNDSVCLGQPSIGAGPPPTALRPWLANQPRAKGIKIATRLVSQRNTEQTECSAWRALRRQKPKPLLPPRCPAKSIAGEDHASSRPVNFHRICRHACLPAAIAGEPFPFLEY